LLRGARLSGGYQQDCEMISLALIPISPITCHWQLCILGSTRTPFAVKGAGHATNPGFSSTKGVHISMTRFNETKVNNATATVEVGAGLAWDQVYAVLESYGVTVVGGRVPGVGVAGLTLGGGAGLTSADDRSAVN
jgi:FAD/FMN-containing dehydrogenase